MEIIIHNSIKYQKIKDYPNYYVSECGKVLSINYNHTKKIKILKLQFNKRYFHITLYNNKKTMFLIHRLIAKTFLPNPFNKPQVDHINGIKTDNRVENLRWCTQSENVKFGYENGRIANKPMQGKFSKEHNRSKKIRQLDLDNNLIKVWDSMSDVTRELNINISSISLCCSGKKKIARGFKWTYFF